MQIRITKIAWTWILRFRRSETSYKSIGNRSSSDLYWIFDGFRSLCGGIRRWIGWTWWISKSVRRTHGAGTGVVVPPATTEHWVGTFHLLNGMEIMRVRKWRVFLSNSWLKSIGSTTTLYFLHFIYLFWV